MALTAGQVVTDSFSLYRWSTSHGQTATGEIEMSILSATRLMPMANTVFKQ